ncbi:hypothetical protein SSS_10103 [Sarcoptes scabiei]|nr:hypothetical protein SSS_10103 [Sarcoptes scabiei]
MVVDEIIAPSTATKTMKEKMFWPRKHSNLKSLYHFILNTVDCFRRVWNEKLGLKRADKWCKAIIIPFSNLHSGYRENYEKKISTITFKDQVRQNRIFEGK